MAEEGSEDIRRILYEIAAERGGGKTIDALRDGYAELLEEILEAAQDDIGRSAAASALHSAMVRAGLDE
ncbi:hypothetical protein [Thiohalorhabdus methylotrophus]|uniref:Uncharacterized protein n=1 Tax=Thiohalorhabdus methylotrophus TaxID=3242694 RepID=A0ABV4TQA0_9GAMM